MIEHFGITSEGEDVSKVTISNSNGMKASIITFGATLQSLWTPDKEGNLADIVLGFDSPTSYDQDRAYHGAIIGRIAGRITNAQFCYHGEAEKVLTLTRNHGDCCLHGGARGFSRRLWTIDNDLLKDNSVTFCLTSKAGDEGFPGEAKVSITYDITSDNELVLTYKVATTEICPINMTNHSYFNLAGHGSANIYDHIAQIDAKQMPILGSDLMPNGKIGDIPQDALLLNPTLLTRDLVNSLGFDPPGFDAYYIFDSDSAETKSNSARARVEHPPSGRVIELITDQPGVQFYTGNFLPGSTLSGKGGVGQYGRHSGLCLEAQSWPDATSHPNFPDIYVHPGKDYLQVTKYRFSVVK